MPTKRLASTAYFAAMKKGGGGLTASAQGCYKVLFPCGPLAQLVEHLTLNQKVLGSIPRRLTISPLFKRIFCTSRKRESLLVLELLPWCYLAVSTTPLGGEVKSGVLWFPDEWAKKRELPQPE